MAESSPKPPGFFDSQSETFARTLAPGEAWPAIALATGSTLGPYHLHRQLGKGGMGEVFEAEDLTSGRHVALKVLTRGLGDERDRVRFLREGRLAASINHPNTVYVFGTEEISGVPIITMELAAGGTLKDRVAATGPLPPREAVDVILQVCAGLDAAAAGGVLHRDIKPSNCFVDAEGTVKVGDFGLSISTHAREGDDPEVSRAGMVIGTPAFASPEQLRGDALDVRADIYSVSATLYYLLTGHAPFEETNLVQLLTMVAQAAPPSPRRLAPAIPRGLAEVVVRGLAKRPADRFAGYRDLVAALEPYRSAAAVSPATLGRRVLAYAVDSFALYLVVTAAGLAAFAWLGLDGLLTPAAIRLATIAGVLLTFVYFAASESLWSASPGKRLCGLRVVDRHGHRPSAARVLLRTAVFVVFTGIGGTSVSITVDTGNASAESTVWRGAADSGIRILLVLILFCAARARNGYAGLHELVTKTRVVTRGAAREWRQHAAPGHAPGAPAAAVARIGPYQVIGDLGPDMRLGYDDRLRRQVWIRPRPAGDAPLDAVRRDLARPARLRWLAGRRTDSASWDAFEAPAGEPLAAAVAAGRPWRVVREWLSDLAVEITAGLRDGSLPDLSVDRVWISPDGRARLLDWPAQAMSVAAPMPAASPVDAASAQRFLAAVADAALQPAGSHPSALAELPLGARATLDRLRHAEYDGAETMQLAVGNLLGGPPAVTSRRRAVHIGVIATPVIALVVTFVMLARALSSLTTSGSPALEALNTIEVLDDLEKRQAGPGAAADGERELLAMRTYASARFAGYQADLDIPAFVRSVLASDDGAPLRRAIALRPNPAPAEVAAAAPIAERLLAAEQDKRQLGNGSMAQTAGMFALWFLLSVGICSVLAAAAVREGPLFRALDIAIVTSGGVRARRWRAAWRALLAWSPIFAIAAVIAVRASLPAPLVWIIAVLAALVFVAGAVMAIRNPAMGLQDRMAGTALTPK